MKKDEQASDEMVMDVKGQILRDGVEVRRRCAEYFELVLNVADVSEANINVVACIVPLYKGKGDKCECSNSRGICFLSVIGKLYGRVLIKRVRAGTECAIGEEQCGFRQGRGCLL